MQHQQPRHHTKLTIGLICLFLSHGLANSTVIVVVGNHTAGFYGDVLGLPTRMHSGILVFSHKEVDSQRSEVPEMLISQVELPRSWWGTRVGLAGPRSRARRDGRKSGSVGASVSDPLGAPRCRCRSQDSCWHSASPDLICGVARS